MNKILGIDPGLATTGYSLLSDDYKTILDSGTITTDKSKGNIVRLYSIRLKMRELMRDTIETVGMVDVAIEDFIFQKRKKKYGDEVPLKSAEFLNRVVQVIVSVSWDLGLDAYLYPAPDVKEAIAGYKKASKKYVEKALSYRLRHLPDNNHALDAAAVALYHSDVMALSRNNVESDTAEIRRMMEKVAACKK